VWAPPACGGNGNNADGSRVLSFGGLIPLHGSDVTTGSQLFRHHRLKTMRPDHRLEIRPISDILKQYPPMTDAHGPTGCRFRYGQKTNLAHKHEWDIPRTANKMKSFLLLPEYMAHDHAFRWQRYHPLSGRSLSRCRDAGSGVGLPIPVYIHGIGRLPYFLSFIHGGHQAVGEPL
jgi:hypothetical protein